MAFDPLSNTEKQEREDTAWQGQSSAVCPTCVLVGYQQVLMEDKLWHRIPSDSRCLPVLGAWFWHPPHRWSPFLLAPFFSLPGPSVSSSAAWLSFHFCLDWPDLVLFTTENSG